MPRSKRAVVLTALLVMYISCRVSAVGPSHLRALRQDESAASSPTVPAPAVTAPTPAATAPPAATATAEATPLPAPPPPQPSDSEAAPAAASAAASPAPLPGALANPRDAHQQPVDLTLQPTGVALTLEEVRIGFRCMWAAHTHAWQGRRSSAAAVGAGMQSSAGAAPLDIEPRDHCLIHSPPPPSNTHTPTRRTHGMHPGAVPGSERPVHRRRRAPVWRLQRRDRPGAAALPAEGGCPERVSAAYAR